MRVLAWITEGGWQDCADAVAGLGADDLTLLYVAPAELTEGPGGALSGLLGRRRAPDLEQQMAGLATGAAETLLRDAAERAGVAGAQTVMVTGRTESVVMEAARDADLLVLARDTRDPGPRSIGHAERFVVDHASCSVLLVWPGGGPSGEAPPPPPGHHRPPHEPKEPHT